MSRTSPPILEETITLTKDAGTGFSTEAVFEKLGDEGRILRVVIMLKAGTDETTEGILMASTETKTPGLIDATTPDTDKPYESDPLTGLVGDDVIAALDDNVALLKGGHWRGGRLKMAYNSTAVGGIGVTTEMTVTVTAERHQ